jgi:hypothetical protein
MYMLNSLTCNSFLFLFFVFLGSGFASNQMFLFGQIDMQIKLVPGYSAGTVVAYYVSDRSTIFFFSTKLCSCLIICLIIINSLRS